VDNAADNGDSMIVAPARDADRPMSALRDRNLPWIVDASNPYLAELLQSCGASEETVRGWAESASSEFWIGRARLVIGIDGEAVGGYIAMRGDELASCRRSDMARLLKTTPKPLLRQLSTFLKATGALFAPVSPDDFYLSKVGVLGAYRQQGLGSRLVADWLAQGVAMGSRCFRLDVSKDNAAAISLYERHGFSTFYEGRAPDYQLGYVSMQLTR